MVGKAATMRCSLVILPALSCGTLKSTLIQRNVNHTKKHTKTDRIKTRLSFKSTLSMESFEANILETLSCGRQTSNNIKT
jgi:hypothetical protein